jgi:hypothetical protein
MERLPRAKLVRTLDRTIRECARWEAAYADAAQQTDAEHLTGRFAARVAILQDAQMHLLQAVNDLAGLPR